MPGKRPKKVEEIVKELKREHPDWPEDRIWATAYYIYNKQI